MVVGVRKEMAVNSMTRRLPVPTRGSILGEHLAHVQAVFWGEGFLVDGGRECPGEACLATN